MNTVVHIFIKEPYVEEMLAKINEFLLIHGDKIEITIEHNVNPDDYAHLKRIMPKKDEK
jgi:hypothetical protein